MTSDEIIEQAMKLPVSERVKIADAIYTALGHPSFVDPQCEKAWTDELDARIKDAEANPGSLLSWDQCASRVRKAIERNKIGWVYAAHHPSRFLCVPRPFLEPRPQWR